MHRIVGHILLFNMFIMSCTYKEQRIPALTSPRPVQVIKVEDLGITYRQYNGIIQSSEFVTLAFKFPGKLQSMKVQTGQHVKKGEIIATIQNHDYQFQYNTAQSNYQTAKSIYERNQRLLTDGATAIQAVEMAKADFLQAESALKISNNILEDMILRAPFDGFIEKKFVDHFEEIQAGQPIVQLVNPQKMEIHFVLPESNMNLLHIPRNIYVEFNSPKGKRFHADMKAYIYASSGSGIPIVLEIKDQAFIPYQEQIFPGFSCKIIWEINQHLSNGFFIPLSALDSINHKSYVWLVNPDTKIIYKKEVDGIRMKGQILVNSGLNRNDLIITAGIPSLKEGDKVNTNKE